MYVVYLLTYLFSTDTATATARPNVQLCTIYAVISASLVASQDPCDSSLLMEDLDGGRRSPNYTTELNTANLCDYQLDECMYQPLCLQSLRLCSV